jgi:hypothetical protein
MKRYTPESTDETLPKYYFNLLWKILVDADFPDFEECKRLFGENLGQISVHRFTAILRELPMFVHQNGVIGLGEYSRMCDLESEYRTQFAREVFTFQHSLIYAWLSALGSSRIDEQHKAGYSFTIDHPQEDKEKPEKTKLEARHEQRQNAAMDFLFPDKTPEEREAILETAPPCKCDDVKKEEKGPCWYFNDAMGYKAKDRDQRLLDFFKSGVFDFLTSHWNHSIWQILVRLGLPDFKECLDVSERNIAKLTIGDLDDVIKDLTEFYYSNGGKRFSEVAELARWTAADHGYFGERIFGKYRYGITLTEFLRSMEENKEAADTTEKVEVPDSEKGVVRVYGPKEPDVYELHLKFYAGEHTPTEVYGWLGNMDWDKIQNLPPCKLMDIMFISMNWNHIEGRVPVQKIER